MTRMFLALSLLLTAAGCGTTRAPTKVLRQPSLVLPGSQYHLTVNTTCLEDVRGPDKVRKVLAKTEEKGKEGGFNFLSSAELSTLTLERKTYKCARPDVAKAITAMVRQAVEADFAKAGYTANPVGIPVTLQVGIRHLRQLQRWSKHTDRKKDKTCQKACGQKTCTKFRWLGQVDVEAHVVGPPFETHEQRHLLLFGQATLGNSGERMVHACSAASLLPAFNDPKRYDWSQVARYVGAKLRDPDAVIGLSRPFRVQYDLTLFDSGNDTSLFAKGLTLAKQAAAKASAVRPKDWAPAADAFEAAVKAGASDEAKGRSAHNLAAIQMVQGQLARAMGTLEEAVEYAERSKDEDALDNLKSLRQEVQRRQLDERKRLARKGRLAGR